MCDCQWRRQHYCLCQLGLTSSTVIFVLSQLCFRNAVFTYWLIFTGPSCQMYSLLFVYNLILSFLRRQFSEFWLRYSFRKTESWNVFLSIRMSLRACWRLLWFVQIMSVCSASACSGACTVLELCRWFTTAHTAVSPPPPPDRTV